MGPPGSFRLSGAAFAAQADLYLSNATASDKT
jgi:hypothetical protein